MRLQLTTFRLSNTPKVRICVGPSTLETPLGHPFYLPIGLVKHYSGTLRRHFDSDADSAAAECGFYVLPNTDPIHFGVLASYVSNGHAKFITNIGLPMCTSAKLSNPIIQTVSPEVLAFCQSADEINTFIALCDKLEMNEAVSSILEAYVLCCRFGALHKIFPMPCSVEMMPWGPLGRLLDTKNEEIWKMLPAEFKQMTEEVLKQIVDDAKELETAIFWPQAKTHGADASDKRTQIAQITVETLVGHI